MNEMKDMRDPNDDTLGELQKIEEKTKVLENLSTRLDVLEKQMENLTRPKLSVPHGIDRKDFQRIITKISSLRELIDKIEIEINHLDSRITDIESLRFKHRTDG